MKTLIMIFSLICSSSILAQQSSREYSLFDVMQLGSSASEMDFSEEQAFEMSVAVVKGYIDSITEGRVINIPYPNATFTYNTALFKIEVTDVLKGDVGKYVYVEYIRGAMPAEAFDAVKDMGELNFYLREIDWYPETAVITDSPKGLMGEVDHLYALFSSELFFKSYKGNAPTAPLPPIPLPDIPRDSNGNPYRDPPQVRTGRIDSNGIPVPITEGNE